MYTLYQQENINKKYRVFVGFTEASETEFTVSFYLMDRETGASVYEDSKTVTNTQMGGNKDNALGLTFNDKMFQGKIALYGMFGRSVTLDKIYAIEQDTTLEKLKLKYFEAPYAWMKDNVVTTYNVNYVDGNQKVVLKGSTHNGNDTQGPDNLRVRDMSYVAFNGDYGLNDFVVFDFTGNNMPIVSFFNDQVTNTVYNTDGMTARQNKGIVFMNGATNKLGNPNIGSYHKPGGINDRLMMYGPNKTYKTGSDADGFFRENITGNGAPIGLYALTQAANANKKYRVILGFTEGSTTGCKVALCVIDLDTGAVYEKQKTVTQTFAENYFTGSIALYSHFGIQTTLDKLYAIEQDTTMSALKAKYAANA
jgi:hypothetical protein